MNEQELTNLKAFLTAGTTVLNQGKSLEESHAISGTALQLFEKIKTMISPEKVGPENPENLG